MRRTFWMILTLLQHQITSKMYFSEPLDQLLFSISSEVEQRYALQSLNKLKRKEQRLTTVLKPWDCSFLCSAKTTNKTSLNDLSVVSGGFSVKMPNNCRGKATVKCRARTWKVYSRVSDCSHQHSGNSAVQ